METIWLTDPEAHDYPAALDYLELIYPLDKATNLVECHLYKNKLTIQVLDPHSGHASLQDIASNTDDAHSYIFCA